MLRKLLAAAGCLVLMTAVASPLEGQQRRGGFGSMQRGPMSLVTLAANEAVQKDLGVAEVDARRLRELNDQYRAATGRAQSGTGGFDLSLLRELNEEERRIAMEEIAARQAEETAKVNAEFEAKLAEIVSPEEIGRLKQIRFQSQGADALYDAEAAKELNLTDQQTAMLAEIRGEFESRQRGFGQRGAPGGGGPDAFARIREMNAEREAKLMDVLTAEQKAKLADMKGHPFDVSQIRFGFGRRNN